jgi:hypothetical protein
MKLELSKLDIVRIQYQLERNRINAQRNYSKDPNKLSFMVAEETDEAYRAFVRALATAEHAL